jgi:hypothetical protein
MMPFTTEPDTTFSPYLNDPFTPPEEELPPSLAETFRAGFAQENDVAALLHMTRQKQFPAEDGFDLVAGIKKRGLWDRRELFEGALSNAELDAMVSQVREEDANNDALRRAGWVGTATRVAGGTLSPTMFIPIAGGASKLGALAKAALSVAAGTALQEGALFVDQRTRTWEEGAYSIGASAILGGILGAAAHTLSRSEFEKMASDMASAPGDKAIQHVTPFSSEASAGAQVTYESAGKLKYGPGVEAMSKFSPITRGIEQAHAPSFIKEAGGSPIIREVTSKFSQGGLRLARNVEGVAGSPGGNLEGFIKTYARFRDEGAVEIRNTYSRMVFDENVPRLVPFKRAYARGMAGVAQMSYPEFKRRVVRALAGNFNDPNKYVNEAAQLVDKKVFQPLYEEGIDVGIFTGKEKVIGDVRYVTHVWDQAAVRSRTGELIDILAGKFERKLRAEFSDAWAKFQEKMGKLKTFAEDQDKSAEEIAQLREALKTRKQELEEADTFVEEELAYTQLRKAADEEKDAKLKQEKRKAARDFFDKQSPEFKQFLFDKRAVAARLRNLAQATVEVNARFQKKLAKIERAEELQKLAFVRAIKQGYKILELAKRGDKGLPEALAKFKNDFAKIGEEFDNTEEVLTKLQTEEGDVFGVIAEQTSRSEKLDEIAARIEELDAFDPKAFAKEVDDMLSWMVEEKVALNARRAVRAKKLEEQAKALSPEAHAVKVAEAKGRLRDIPIAFRERFRHADDIDMEKGTATFNTYAKEIATDAVEKIKGSDRRLAYSDLIQEKRGPELARVLNVGFHELPQGFLEEDIEKIISVYTRTLGADISLARVFGTLNMEDQFAKLTEEGQKAIAAIDELKNKSGQLLTKAEKEKLTFEVTKFYDDARKDFEVLLERARGIRGIPQHPEAIASRMGIAAMQINSMRFLGSVVIASVSDPARAVMKYGLRRTFRDGIIPMITNFKKLRMSQKEARLAGVANDVVTHSRAHTFNDVFEDTFDGTMVERGMAFLSNRTGLIAGFDLWNATMKQFTGAIVNAKLMDSIAIVMGESATKKELKEATEFLASVNITDDIAQTIWEQVIKNGGANKVNGVWLPNTELWDVALPQVARARRAYRAALASEIDDTIITPGMERPNFMDANLITKMVMQFRSFAMSSTTKTVMAGLQQRDMAVVNGMAISLALGALSYYLYGVTVGGRQEEEMREASLDKWFDEAISRSGLLGAIDLAQNTAQRIPGISRFASISGQRVTRREGGDLLDGLLGPSFDLAETGARIAVGIDDPTQGTIHQVRKMIPFQNVFYLRRLLTQVEDATASNFPEKRAQ